MHFSFKTAFRPESSPEHHTFRDFLKWKCIGGKARWPKRIVKPFCVVPPQQVLGPQLQTSWVGHCTFLIQTHGLNILTDPVWSERVGPAGLGPKRVQSPGIPFELLPKIDAVLISHNHYDHLDLRTLRRLWQEHDPIFITPLGNDKIIRKISKKARILAGDWGSIHPIKEDVQCFIEPAVHWSARSLWDKNHSLWGAFLIQTPTRKIYFAGDTGYADGSHFEAIRQKHGELDLAFLPIGAFKPRWFMRRYHMDPIESVLAWEKLGQPHAVPMHYQTFPLANEGYNEPLELLLSESHRWANKANGFHPLAIGQGFVVPMLQEVMP
jgi:L-ascorbate metabolism protein UlaG (beta-lactamase superfamily)